MKKEIIIKRVRYNSLTIWIDYVFIPIKMPCWILDNWFTLNHDRNSFIYSTPIIDQCRDEILELLSDSSGCAREDIYIVRNFTAYNNKIVTRNTLKEIIGSYTSNLITGQMYSPVLVKFPWCVKSATYKLTMDTEDLVIGCVHPSIDSIFTKIIQDEEKL